MTNAPNGQLSPVPGGLDLIVRRSFRAPIDDVWASVTEPERTARWFGRWEGEGGTGRTIKFQMAYEESAPWFDARIDACEPPRRLALSTADAEQPMRLELLLTHDGGVTELRLVQHMTGPEGVGEWGPGWEYYLDMLVAVREGRPAPSFDDYYPAMTAHYEALVP